MVSKYKYEIEYLFFSLRDKATSYYRKDKLSERDYETYLRLRKNYFIMFGYDDLLHRKGKIDYLAKAVVLEYYSYDLKCVRKARYWQYLLETGDAEKFANSLSDKEKYEWQCYIIRARELEFDYPSLYKEIVRIINADRQRRLRLKNRISRILEKGNAYFVTLTFNDDVLANTQPHIRRKYASELIREISNDYVGNIDFGKKNGREHYHFVLHTDTFNNLEYKKTRDGYISTYASSIDSWSKNGLYFIKQCGNSDSDSTALAKYTTKLTNHAIKETTKRNALIYSR